MVVGDAGVVIITNDPAGRWIKSNPAETAAADFVSPQPSTRELTGVATDGTTWVVVGDWETIASTNPTAGTAPWVLVPGNFNPFFGVVVRNPWL